jgi:hypothetical protein
MLRRASFRLCLAAALLFGRAGLAGEIVTDADLVTGPDISHSVTSVEMQGGLEGMARAIRSPEVLAAIRRGPAGRIGFAVFVGHRRQFEVVPWTVISTECDAEAVVQALEVRIPAPGSVARACASP